MKLEVSRQVFEKYSSDMSWKIRWVGANCAQRTDRDSQIWRS